MASTDMPVIENASPEEAHAILSERAATHAREQFDALWEQVLPVVRKCLAAALPDPAVREDILQNTALAAFRKMDTFDRTRSFTAWVLGIARFEILQLQRSFARSRIVFNSEIMESVETAYEHTDTHYDDRLEMLQHCIQELAPEKRRLVVLRYAEHLSYEEIARELGCQEGAVRTALCRIRGDLKTAIEEKIRKNG